MLLRNAQDSPSQKRLSSPKYSAGVGKLCLRGVVSDNGHEKASGVW